MAPLQVLVLSLLQGLTEFLPISSSAHLILVPRFLGWPDQGLTFDVAVHAGTLVAVVAYFRADLLAVVRGLAMFLARRAPAAEARLAWLLILATVPVGVSGLLLHETVEGPMRAFGPIAATTIGFGVLLGLADRLRGTRDDRDIDWKDALWIGCAQALAPIPGVSRSGVTVTAGLFRGLTRRSAARFSFLIAVPTLVLAGGYETLQLVRHPETADWRVLLLGAALSGASAFACIHFLLRWIERMGLMPFVIYRLALGGLLIALALMTAGDRYPEESSAWWRSSDSETERNESGVSSTRYPGATIPSRE